MVLEQISTIFPWKKTKVVIPFAEKSPHLCKCAYSRKFPKPIIQFDLILPFQQHAYIGICGWSITLSLQWKSEKVNKWKWEKKTSESEKVKVKKWKWKSKKSESGKCMHISKYVGDPSPSPQWRKVKNIFQTRPCSKVDVEAGLKDGSLFLLLKY